MLHGYSNRLWQRVLDGLHETNGWFYNRIKIRKFILPWLLHSKKFIIYINFLLGNLMRYLAINFSMSTPWSWPSFSSPDKRELKANFGLGFVCYINRLFCWEYSMARIHFTEDKWYWLTMLPVFSVWRAQGVKPLIRSAIHYWTVYR